MQPSYTYPRIDQTSQAERPIPARSTIYLAFFVTCLTNDDVTRAPNSAVTWPSLVQEWRFAKWFERASPDSLPLTTAIQGLHQETTLPSRMSF